MANFTNEHLAYTGYTQTTTGSDLPTEISKINYIDKTEEQEVVNFCNQFLKKYKVPKTKASFQRVECLLHHTVLENEANREALFDWIASHWVKL